jgi:hypothetical protein
VYIPVTKRPDASTLTVVGEVRANLGRFQALVPDDIKVSYELDQSRSVSASLQAVLREAIIGALLTGVMVLIFLGDWRSAGIVVVSIPLLLASVIALWGAGRRNARRSAVWRWRLFSWTKRRSRSRTSTLSRGGWSRACSTPAGSSSSTAGHARGGRGLRPSFFMRALLAVQRRLAVGFSMIASFVLAGTSCRCVDLAGHTVVNRARPDAGCLAGVPRERLGRML